MQGCNRTGDVTETCDADVAVAPTVDTGVGSGRIWSGFADTSTVDERRARDGGAGVDNWTWGVTCNGTTSLPHVTIQSSLVELVPRATDEPDCGDTRLSADNPRSAAADITADAAPSVKSTAPSLTPTAVISCVRTPSLRRP
jgi:hypothetical protein